MVKNLHEECGVFGVYSPYAAPLAKDVYYGLYALQHRGQESCGIVVCNDGIFTAHRDIGEVGTVFDGEALERFPDATMAVGHVRYSTTGGEKRENTQPMQINHQKGKMAIAHNGNISNAYELRSNLELSGAIFHSTSDTEIIAYLVTRQRLSCPSIEQALLNAMDDLEGAYSLVLMSAAKLIAARDPYGFRPLCYGKMRDGGYVIASESCALSAVGASFIRDVMPGEVIVFSSDGVKSLKRHCNSVEKKTCIFEYIYFARPDSVIDGVSVHAARLRAGNALAKIDNKKTAADVVIGVPDSGIDAALGYSAASGIPYGIGLIKNKYIGRTFISPSQDERANLVRIKLSPVRSTIEGKSVVLIDDSIVRGTTSAHIVRLLREAGAKQIHMRISAPKFLFPCFYGTDIDSKENLIANNHTTEEIRQIIGADSLEFLPLESLSELTGALSFCDACFSGKYPTAVPLITSKDRFERPLSKRND